MHGCYETNKKLLLQSESVNLALFTFLDDLSLLAQNQGRRADREQIQLF